MSWLVTGGAGYIGSHVVRALLGAGLEPVVLDDLSSGHADFVPPEVAFAQGTLLDAGFVRRVFADNVIDGVIHIAGFKYAGESVRRPLHTYEQNVVASVVLLRAMADAGVDKIVFSSSCATYGAPEVDRVSEATPTSPESPYGESKLVVDWLLRDLGATGSLRHTSLRYFNVVGSGTPELCDTSPHNLFPLVFDALARGDVPAINGTDYATPDGTCIRDYLHVADLAHSHAVAAQALMNATPLEAVYNLGSGVGSSVREIMNAVQRVTGIAFQPTERPRRPGDPARVVADGALAQRDVDWQMRHTLDDMVGSAWQARQARAARTA